MHLENAIAELEIELEGIDIALAILDEHIRRVSGSSPRAIGRNMELVHRKNDLDSDHIPTTSALQVIPSPRKEIEMLPNTGGFLNATRGYEAWGKVRSPEMGEKVRLILVECSEPL
jgi:hypothetical protein